MKSPHDHTKKAYAFEEHVADNAECPKCDSILALFPRNEPATDAFCTSGLCRVEIQIKLNSRSQYHGHPQDKAAFVSKVRKIGKANLYFAIGLEGAFLLHSMKTGEVKPCNRRRGKTRKLQKRIRVSFAK